MVKRICNWCTKVMSDVAGIWTHTELTITGLNDGSIPWLPSKSLDFCSDEGCQKQLSMVEDFVDTMPDDRGGSIEVTLVVDRGGVGVSRARRMGHGDAAADARALARFFTCTSHPRNRAFLEGFYGTEGPS